MRSVSFSRPESFPCLLAAALALAACSAESVDPGVDAGVPRPPRARAGDAREVVAGDTVTLDGSASSDPERGVLAFAWTLEAPEGSGAVLSDHAVARPSFVADLAGEYVATLVVASGGRSSEPSVVRITARAPPPVNLPPVANAGADSTVARGVMVVLQGDASADPENAALQYTWTLAAKPASSAARLAGDRSAKASFRVDAPGVYRVALVVHDGVHASEPDEVVVTARNEVPVADAGADLRGISRRAIALDGTRSRDADGDALTFSWSLATKPPGSTPTFTGTSTARPELVADTAGTYVARLVVSDGFAESRADTVSIVVEPRERQLSFRVVDAEFSAAVGRLVMVSADPNRLHTLNPITGDQASVPLDGAPTSLSISPDGLHAVVGHERALSFVDLASAAVERRVTVSCVVRDVVLASGWAYAFPEAEAASRICSVDLALGSEAPPLIGSEDLAEPGSMARLHPNGAALYVASSRLVPDVLQRYAVGSGPASKTGASPDQGRATCGAVWPSRDGERLYTACANVFRASDDPAQDMTFVSTFAEATRLAAVDDARVSRRVAAIAGTNHASIPNAREVLVWATPSLAHELTLAIPPVSSDGRTYPAEGRFVFFSADGKRLFVVARADAGALVSGDTVFVLTP